MYLPRVHLDIDVGLGDDILDLVDPWLQFPIFEDIERVTGRVQGHGRQIKDLICNTRGEHERGAY